MIRPLLTAIQFLTILPVRLNSNPSDQEVGRSLIYYPVVGFIVGALLVLFAAILEEAPVMIVSALLLSAWVILTGGLHLDGLADCADAMVGGLGDKQKTLDILKDPYCGPAGVIGIVLVLLIKFVALVTVVEKGGIAPLLITPVVSRTVIPILFFTTSYVRPNGLGSIIASQRPDRLVILVSCLVISLVIMFIESSGLVLILIAVCVLTIFRAWALRRIGGITGDVAGALIEILEVVILVLFALK